MLAIISPAKTLDFSENYPKTEVTEPELLKESEQLIQSCQALNPAQLASLMKISDKLACLNVARFGSWTAKHSLQNSKPAIYAFQGEVYTGLSALSLSSEQIDFAQQHLRILSGLYGVLKPLDLMQPYRLEMGTKLTNPKGKNLYDFWGQIITEKLQKALAEQEDNILLNLASEEYFKSVKKETLQARIIKPIFLDQKKGKYKVISFYAKKARGLMCRYLIENKIKNVEELKNFRAEGYYFEPKESTQNEWVFKRDESVKSALQGN